MVQIFSVSIGICAYNEEKNIGKLLDGLLVQKQNSIRIKEIIVVSSGSTDRTNEIVKGYEKKNAGIKLITQKKREGKSSAVNMIIRNAKGDIVVLESGDTIPKKDTIEELCALFYDPSIGMVGGHPIPTNDKNRFMGFVGNLLWRLHHEISLESTKAGEIVAFRRNFVKEIPKESAVDEAEIQYQLTKKGLKIAYAPNAICYNRTPETFLDYIKQRRRIYAGHYELKKRDYDLPTMNSKIIFKKLFKTMEWKPKNLLWTTGTIFLEGFCKIMGWYDFKSGKDHKSWNIATSTKEVIK